MYKIRKQKKAFTLVELLVVISIIAILLAMIIPALGGARQQAKTVICTSNLKQFGQAFGMYLADYSGNVFMQAYIGKNEQGELGTFWYYGFEPTYASSLPEGERPLFRKYAKLYPYIEQYDSIEICPAFPYGSGMYKPKYNTKWMTYGINANLSLDRRGETPKYIDLDNQVKSPQNLLIFADSAQVNTFQSPASPSNPMVEEWHYVESGKPFIHFRHNQKANILFGDGHVSASKPEKDSIDRRMPELNIGRFDKEIRF
ncbi:MAG: prepilin-type N-terminal cleavage/methylation domain-containing protein [Phycisphaerae bacterium]|jgi:type II secretory pathway pseudopilin PulG